MLSNIWHFRNQDFGSYKIAPSHNTDQISSEKSLFTELLNKNPDMYQICSEKALIKTQNYAYFGSEALKSQIKLTFGLCLVLDSMVFPLGEVTVIRHNELYPVATELL